MPSAHVKKNNNQLRRRVEKLKKQIENYNEYIRHIDDNRTELAFNLDEMRKLIKKREREIHEHHRDIDALNVRLMEFLKKEENYIVEIRKLKHELAVLQKKEEKQNV